MTAPLTSRGALGWMGAVLAGGMSAGAFAFAFAHAETMLIFLAYLGAVPLFVAGLGGGSGAAIIAVLAGTGGVFAFHPNPVLALSYIAVNAVPVAVLVILALRARTGNDGKVYWYPEGYLLTAITLYPCLVFLGMVAAFHGQEGGLLGQSTQMLQMAFEPMTAELEPGMAENFKAMLAMLPRMLPALLGCSWIFLTLISMIAAQTMLKQQKWNLRPSFGWLGMHIPNWVILAAATTAVAAFTAPTPYDYIAGNLCALLCLPFFFTGLAVVHLFAATTKAKIALLIFVYAVLTLFPWAAILAALLGALDQVFNFRQRLPQRTTTQGEDT